MTRAARIRPDPVYPDVELWPELVGASGGTLVQTTPDSTSTLTVTFDIRQCWPTAKTKSFALVQRDGQSVELNSAGNAKAAEITRNMHKKSAIRVIVTGEKTKAVVNVDSIAIDR